MTRGLYAAANSMLVQASKQDIVAANLANVDTAGYRRDVPSVAGYSRLLADIMASGESDAAGLSTAAAMAPRPWLEVTANVDLRPGAARATGNPCDLTIEGDGFFVVETPQGLAYTRAGNFRLAADGQLVTIEGHPVLGDNGPVRIQGSDWEVAASGDVMVDGQRADRLRLALLPASAPMRKLGHGLVVAADVPKSAEGARVKQGYLETSNVNMIEEMTTMIATLRAYESAQRAFTAQDESLGRLINEVSQVG
jgi:flagellar basal-body rod protein FlgF